MAQAVSVYNDICCLFFFTFCSSLSKDTNCNFCIEGAPMETPDLSSLSDNIDSTDDLVPLQVCIINRRYCDYDKLRGRTASNGDHLISAWWGIQQRHSRRCAVIDRSCGQPDQARKYSHVVVVSSSIPDSRMSLTRCKTARYIYNWRTLHSARESQYSLRDISA